MVPVINGSGLNLTDFPGLTKGFSIMRKQMTGSALRYFIVIGLAALSILAAACEKDEGRVVDGDSDTDTDTDSDTDADSDIDQDTSGDAPPGCGDGELAENEACDDANTESGDGCAGNCLFVAEGYSCNPPGQPCRRMAICGDGHVNVPELCDDGNVADGDGCSDHCQVEIGYKCSGTPSECTATLCGDSVIEGAEGCDDGNDIPFDGCNSLCQLEPDCSSADGACSSDCGDGLVLNEACDDGNNLDGDGCSATCEVEEGYECHQEGCEDEETCTLRVAAVFRDFTSTHPDFGVTCATEVFGMVEDELGSDWKPVATSVAATACTTSFDDWYNEEPAKVGFITLYPDGDGNFVNRYGENGEVWQGQTDQPISDQPCTGAAVGVTCLPCRYVPNQSCGIVPFDGNPMFFPVDDLGTDMANAKIPEQYGYDGWPWEYEIFPDAPMHSFYFTTEVTYWFAYDADATAILRFTGDRKSVV